MGVFLSSLNGHTSVFVESDKCIFCYLIARALKKSQRFSNDFSNK